MNILRSEELFTDRLHLRRPVATDAAATISIVGNWEVARRLARIPHPYDQSCFDFFLEHVVHNEPTWAIVLRATQEIVGMTSLKPDPAHSSAELGYYLGRPHWSYGFATEAGRALVRYGFERLGCTTLTSRYHADNPASGRVLAKLGFKPSGTTNCPSLADGKDRPSIDVKLEFR